VVTAVANCQVCGSHVNVHGNVATCLSCGAEYDVIRHGRGRDFSKSAEVAVNAAKIPTSMRIWIVIGTTPYGPGSTPPTQYVGNRIILRFGVIDSRINDFINPQNVDVKLYRKVDGGAYALLTAAAWIADDAFDYAWTVDKAGTHTFYVEWPGTDKYAGCGEETHAMRVSGDYSLSPEVAVNVAAAFTVIVKDRIFKKPIEGAKVSVDGRMFGGPIETLTDATGTAIFETLAPIVGNYTVTVSASNYKSETRSVPLTEAGKVEEVHLLPMWAIAAGVVGVGAVGVVAAVKLRKK